MASRCSAGRDVGVARAEALGDLVIERVVLGPPALGVVGVGLAVGVERTEPEVEDRPRFGIERHDVDYEAARSSRQS